jgi:outer membrane protein TolC
VAAFWLIMPPAGAQEVMLTPKTVVEFARRNNTAVLLADYDVAYELRALEAASARMKPSLGLHFSYAHLDEAPTMPGPDLSGMDTLPSYVRSMSTAFGGPTQIGPEDVWDIGYSVKQPVFAGTRLLNAYRAARLSHEGAQLQRERTAREVRVAALRLYWAYVAGMQRIRTLDENVEWLEELTDDLVALVDAGVVVEEEMLKMKTQLAFARLEQARARNDLRDLGEQLLVFCNLPLHNEIVIDTTALGVLENDPDVPRQDTEQILACRSDVVGAVRARLRDGTSGSGRLVDRTFRFAVRPGPALDVFCGHVENIQCPDAEEAATTQPADGAATTAEAEEGD